MYRYGGAYLDSDMISKAPLPTTTTPSFVVAAEPDRLCNGAFRFERPGHTFLLLALQRLVDNFQANKFGQQAR